MLRGAKGAGGFMSAGSWRDAQVAPSPLERGPPPPLGGGGLGGGVSRRGGARGYPPLQLSPTRGERADCASCRRVEYHSTSTSWFRRIPIPHIEPLDFPGRGFWQTIDEIDPARIIHNPDLLLYFILRHLLPA